MEKTRHILANGVSLTTVMDKRFKNEFFSVNFLFPLKGSENALSYLMPSVLVRGCRKYDSMQKLNAALEEAYDGEIGTDVYKAGNTRVIRFSGAWLRGELTFDKTNPGDVVLDIMKEIILFPLKEENGCLISRFTELEKQSLYDFALSEKNNKRSYALSSCIKLMLDGDEYAHPKYGSEEEIMAVTNEELTNFYNYVINNAQIEIYYHGKNDGNLIAENTKKIFAQLITERSGLKRIEGQKAVIKQDIVKKTEKDDCEQTVLAMGFALPNTKEEKYALVMMNEILGLSPVSRLFMNVREKRGLCYYCDMITMRAKQASFVIAGIEYKRLEEAKEAILAEIKDVADGNISDDEFNVAKISVINNYLSFFDSPKDHESMVLYSALGSDYLTPEEHERTINGISKEMVSEMAKKLQLQTIFILTGN